MDVTGGLLRLSIPRAFVVVPPGFTAVRLGVERELRRRGWPQALTPANADILALCGDGGHAFADPVDRLWAQIPSPRVFVRMSTPGAIARHFDQARAALCDLPTLRTDAAGRSEADTPTVDMDGMEMDMPGGISMADRGPDRDGLKLDQLHVVLGPVLPDWPSGLVVRLVLQGDIVQSAELEVVGVNDHPSFWLDAEIGTDGHSRVRAAAAADSLQRFLGIAGWPSAAATGRWLRDELLASGSDAVLDPRFARWLRRVRRSRMLRWSMNGLGRVGSDAPAELRGDVSARYLRWTDEIASAIDVPVVDPQPATVPWGSRRAERAHRALALLPAMLVGQELAAARLIVASFDPDLETLHALALPDSP